MAAGLRFVRTQFSSVIDIYPTILEAVVGKRATSKLFYISKLAVY
jgi:arylsulfatase A-like enzyme